LALKKTHFFKSTIKLAVLLCREKDLLEEGNARPGEAISIPLANTMWSPDADNCYQLLAVNVPEYPYVGRGDKKTKIHSERLMNSHLITIATVSQPFFYALFIAHTRYTFVLCTSYWQYPFTIFVNVGIPLTCFQWLALKMTRNQGRKL
jgi:hypothetical protein